LSLSLKRVDDGAPAHPKPGEDSEPPTIDLSEDVFSDEAAVAAPVAELDEGDDADADADDDGEEPESTDDVEPAEDADSDEAVPAE
jgi:hypothetical protein